MSEEVPKKKVNRRVWSNAETKALLACYAARKAEFDHPRRKKFAMQNVLEDLISQNVLLQPTTVECLQIKMKNLQRAYKSGKDGNMMTGGSPVVVPFEEEMDDIFGSQPNISNSHTLNLSGEPIVALLATDNSEAAQSLPSPSPSSSIAFLSPQSPTPTSSFTRNPTPSTSILISQSPSPSPTPSPSPSSSPSQRPPKRLSKNDWYAAKTKHLKVKEEMMQKYFERAERAREERFNKFMAAKEKHHDEKMNILKKVINKEGLGKPKE